MHGAGAPQSAAGRTSEGPEGAAEKTTGDDREDAKKASDDAEDAGGGGAGGGEGVEKAVSKRCRQHAIRVSSDKRGDLHVLAHRAPREKDAEARGVIVEGVKKNRFCSILDDKQIDAIVDSLEYFKFEANDTIVKQGDTGNYFFVVQEGTCEVSVNGSLANTLSRGVAFGAISLLYGCPRTATVTAQSPCGVWGADGNLFRKIMREHSRLHHAENCQFLNSIRLFDGLSANMKGHISELALVVERFGQGSRVVTEGEAATAMYFVKRGELSKVRGGKLDASGALTGGSKVALLCAGHCFGEHAALYSEPHDATVVADGDCELVCMGILQLKEVLGDDLAECLEQSFLCSVLRLLPLVSHLSPAQHRQLARSMAVRSLAAGQEVEEGLRLLVVLDGEVAGAPRGGPVLSLRRGQWGAADSDLWQQQGEGGPAAGASQLAGLAAGAGGARVAALSGEGLAEALRALGLSQLGAGEQGAVEHMRRLLLARKVPIFSQLSAEQVDQVAGLLVRKRYTRRAQVFRQGEAGGAFFVIADGELSVLLDGQRVRTLRQGTYFGERALLLDEPRSATVEVAGEAAELWSLDRQAFQQVVTETMRSDLVLRIRLQDSDFTMKSLRHVRLIGAGAFGSVRLVEHRHTGQRYALKRVRKADGQVPEEVSREWQLLEEIDHPFVLRMVRTFETSSSVYILTELITGGQLCEEVHERMGLLSRKQAQFYTGCLIVILESLHQLNIAYRDLKPENVMLDVHGYLKLVDFGLAKKLDSKVPRTYTVVGTPLYMAPEVVKGAGYGLEVDLWSLGIMLFEFVCGSLPFGVGLDSIDDLMAAVLHDELQFPARYNDQAGKKLIQGLLQKDPKSRLGAGADGWESVKTAKFFKAGVQGDLFNTIMGRAAVPPVVPDKEQYSRERELNASISLSDAEELGSGGGADKPTAVFRLFDSNGDGKISREELRRVLQRLDPATFHDEAIAELLEAADTNHDGHICFEEFMNWLASDDAEPLRRAVDADLEESGRQCVPPH